jgi:hypothetical protein
MTRAFDLLTGTPFGYVLPPRNELPLRSNPGRTVALKILRDYISELRFTRPGPNGHAIGYQIPTSHIHLEQPGREDLRFPSIVIRPGEGSYDPIGLVAYIDEATRDLFGDGTVVQEQSEWREVITLECWAEESPQRASMVAGLEQALVPTEQLYGLRFRMPDYYDRTCCFSLWNGSYPDDAEAAKNRRWALLQIELRYHVCALVYSNTFKPVMELEVDEFPVETVLS